MVRCNDHLPEPKLHSLLATVRGRNRQVWGRTLLRSRQVLPQSTLNHHCSVKTAMGRCIAELLASFTNYWLCTDFLAHPGTRKWSHLFLEHKNGSVLFGRTISDVLCTWTWWKHLTVCSGSETLSVTVLSDQFVAILLVSSDPSYLWLVSWVTLVTNLWDQSSSNTILIKDHHEFWSMTAIWPVIDHYQPLLTVIKNSIPLLVASLSTGHRYNPKPGRPACRFQKDRRLGMLADPCLKRSLTVFAWLFTLRETASKKCQNRARHG